MDPILELPSDVSSFIGFLLFYLVLFCSVYYIDSLTPAASPHVCLFCGNGTAYLRCSRCTVARYCSETCQKKHWKVHKLECKEYKSPDIIESAAVGSSERRGTSHMGISSSDHHRDRDEMPSTSTNTDMCLICDDWAARRCSRCKVAKYCSEICQIKHWREGHILECEEYESPANADSASSVSSEGSGTSHVGISSSDHHRDRNQMPSTSTHLHICVVCNDWALSRCSRCKVAKYCSETCQIKDWKEGHMLECKEYKPPNSVDSAPGVTSERRGSGHMDISSSGRHSNRDESHEMPSSSASSHICFVCGDLADTRCSSCKITTYCSETCQLRHWKEGHKLECKEYRSLANENSVPAVSSERRGSGHMGISSHRDRDQMPSTSTSSHICFVCGHWADACCSRCNVTRYCSETCQIKHWNEGHRLECKEYRSPANEDSVPAVSSERRGSGHMGISSSDHHRYRDQMPSTSASPHICFVCGHWADARCSRCNVTRYCSETCQIKDWKEGHKLECKEYRSPANVDSVPAVSSKRRGSDHLGISSSDHHTDRDQMPSAPASRDFCFVCDDWAASHCSRCKAVRYCSQTCQIKHWRAGHRLECKEDKSPTNVDSASAIGSESRGSGHMGISSSEYQRSKKDGKLAETVQSSSKGTYSKELRSVEDCPICFITIHTSEPCCPLLACDICKHKFHSACLLKWFSISRKSRCPLCQSPFKSGGAAL